MVMYVYNKLSFTWILLLSLLKGSVSWFVFPVTLYSHKQEADDIVRVAKTANDTSAEAYNLLLRTLAGENQTAFEIEELNRKWVQFKMFL